MFLHKLTVFLLLSCYLIFSAAQGNGTSIAYRTGEWMTGLRNTFRDDSILISCQTNEPYANVYLCKRDGQSDPWKNITEKDNLKNRVSVLGQSFLIHKLSVRDSGYYRCSAYWNSSVVELLKGQLAVNPGKKTRIPVIIPNTPAVRLELDEQSNITCHTLGAPGAQSILTWHKRASNGSLVRINSSRIDSESAIIGGNNIDIEKLMFRPFIERDAGEYVCKRQIGDEEATQRNIILEIEPVFTYKTRRWLLGKIASVRMALVGDFVWISCQTSTPHANVTLMRKTKATDRWEKVSAKEDSGRIMQMYQNFLIKRITHKDSGFYRCNATDHRNHTILLKKGKLIVSVVKDDNPPEILPNEKTFYIEENGEDKIACQADGIPGEHHSFLKWYRKTKSGSYLYVNRNMVKKAIAFVRGAHRDIHTLNFRNFSEDDAGIYLCVRKVLGRKVTKAVINVQLKGKKQNSALKEKKKSKISSFW